MTAAHLPRRLAAGFSTSLLSLGLLLGLAGCASSPPVHYYTLIASAASASPAGAPTSAPPFQIALLPVRVPAQDDQGFLVLRRSDGQVTVLENERWVAPLSDELRGALSAELVRRLGTPDVAGVAKRVDLPVVQIAVDVQRFDTQADGAASIDLVWSARSTATDGDGVLGCHGAARVPVGAGYAGLVTAHQRAIAQLAQQMAEALGRWDGKSTAACAAPAN